MKSFNYSSRKVIFRISFTVIAMSLLLFTAYDQGEAQNGLYDAIVTCDEAGYSVTLSPDWGPTFYTYDFTNLPDYATRRGSTINMAPSTDPIAETWANIGGPVAYVNFAAHWVQQTRTFIPSDTGWVTDVNVYTNFNLEINQADCVTPPSPVSSTCTTAHRYYMYVLEDVNQPPGWTDYCYIISSSGYPGIDLQAALCTPAGSDHKFRATNIPFGGWVSTDCEGNVHYGWPYWDSHCYRPEYAR